nr:MAG TPA: hypothetical protein [Caudoviricetes sp.]
MYRYGGRQKSRPNDFMKSRASLSRIGDDPE